MTDISKFDVENGVAIIEINSPPVNALSVHVRKAIVAGLEKAWADDAVEAIVIMCAGRTFFAGADIKEFGKPPMAPSLSEVLETMEAGSKPTVAAIHGTALGGGLELALHCNFRVAVPSARMGLPEVKLGILPGAGGTQRLPRLVGVPVALDLITSGRQFKAMQALDYGVIDAVTDEDKLRGDAIKFARKVIDEKWPVKRVRDRQDMVDPYKGNTEVFDTFRQKNARKFRGFPAPENIIKAVQAAVEMPYDAGKKRERELFSELQGSDAANAQKYVFFAERAVNKIPDIDKTMPVRDINTIGVIGAGTMGGGIAMNFLSAGLPVTLVEQTQEALDRGLGVIRRNYETSAKRGRAILASNTSYLDIDEIASATTRPEEVVGLHFFSPANVMKLLEVVRGKHTTADIINTSMKLAAKINKTPVLSRVGYGFIANRVMSVRRTHSTYLALQGNSPIDIDKVIYDYGFSMGPWQVLDLVGLDVLGRGSDEVTVCTFTCCTRGVC